MRTQNDIVIVGAGIVGMATAYQLIHANPNLKISVIEKEANIALHQTGHNSGVIHSGIYYTPGSLKAKNCQRGYRQLIEFCDKNQVEYELCGKVIVATKKKELPQLDIILKKGIQNGLKGIQKISAEATREIEPHVNVLEAIKVPEAGIVNYKAVCNKMAELFQKKDGQIFTNNKLTKVIQHSDYLTAITDKRAFTCKLLINCAGLYADKLALLTGQKIDFKIVPFRGEYYQLKKEKQYLVNHLIYPVPNPDFPFLGVHYTRMITGGIEAGPNAVLAFRREGYSRWDVNIPELLETLSYSGFRKLARKYWKDGIGEMHRSYSKSAFVRALQHLIPEVGNDDLKRAGAGVRAQALRADGTMVEDYLILKSKGIINVCNAPSPAATSSFSIGQTIAELALKQL